MRHIGAPGEHLSDEALLAGFAAGDPELATAFVRRFEAKVFGIAVHVVADARTAEDVAQTAFERAWRHARTYDPRRGSVSAWLGVIARNLAIDTVRVRPTVPIDPVALLDEHVADRGQALGPSGRQSTGRPRTSCELPYGASPPSRHELSCSPASRGSRRARSQSGRVSRSAPRKRASAPACSAFARGCRR